MSVVDELVTILGVDVDATSIAAMRIMKNGLDGIEEAGKRAALSVGVFTTGFAYWLKTIASGAEDLLIYAERTGITAEGVQELSYAVSQLGGDSSNLKNDIMRLVESMTSPVPGQFNETLLQLGVAARNTDGSIRSMEDVIGDLAARFKNMDIQTALQWGNRLGISPDTIDLLRQGRTGITELRKQLVDLGGVTPTAFLEFSKEFNKTWKDIKVIIGSVTDKIGLAFLPKFTEMMKAFREWVKDNKDWVQVKLGEVIEGIGRGLERFWNRLMKLVEAWKPYIKALSDAMGLTGDLRQKTEKFIEIASWGLTFLLAIWALMHSKMLVVAAVIGVVMKALQDLNSSASEENNVAAFFEAVAGSAAFAADVVTSLVRVFDSLVAFLLRMASYVTWIVGQIFKVFDFINNSIAGTRLGKKFGLEHKTGGQTTVDWANAMSEQADAMQKGISRSHNMPSYTSRYMDNVGKKGSSIVNTNNVSIVVPGTPDPNQTAEAVKQRFMDLGVSTPGVTSPVAF